MAAVASGRHGRAARTHAKFSHGSYYRHSVDPCRYNGAVHIPNAWLGERE